VATMRAGGLTAASYCSTTVTAATKNCSTHVAATTHCYSPTTYLVATQLNRFDPLSCYSTTNH